VTPEARDAVARVWLSQLRRGYPHVTWRLIREGEGSGNDSTATPRKRRKRSLSAPGNVESGSDVDDLPA